VEYFMKMVTDSQGNTITEKAVRVTYTQDWSAYNEAQTKEGKLFMKLLGDLCSEISNPEYVFGRPTLPLSDMVFASALKVYSTFSLRRFMSLMNMAKESGFTDTVCSYSTVSNYMRKPELTEILQNLIKITSLPLSSVEKDFAVDSSGFSTSKFGRYYSFKYGKEKLCRTWVKAHVICGVRTNVVTGVEITKESAADSLYFKPLVEKTAESFSISEVSADKAYLSRDNLDTVENVGGIAFIPFKKNSTPRAGGSALWKKMWHYFEFNKEEFLQHYHKRSNSETVFSMIKAKFGGNLRSMDVTSQINEVLLKFLCHNICVLIQETYELGKMPDF
jgi:transposase